MVIKSLRKPDERNPKVTPKISTFLLTGNAGLTKPCTITDITSAGNENVKVTCIGRHLCVIDINASSRTQAKMSLPFWLCVHRLAATKMAEANMLPADTIGFAFSRLACKTAGEAHLELPSQQRSDHLIKCVGKKRTCDNGLPETGT